MRIAPCYNCTDRIIGCHAECRSYKTYADRKHAVREYRAADQRKGVRKSNKGVYFDFVF